MGKTETTIAMQVPSLHLNQRGATPASTQRSWNSNESGRLDELANVKRELEEALRQVKDEMRDNGATHSQVGTSVCSSAMSSRCSSSMSGFSQCSTARSSVRSSRKQSKQSKQSSEKPLVSRPTVNRQPATEPCPSVSAFKPKQFMTGNQRDYVTLALPPKTKPSQGPHRQKPGSKKEITFSKFAENQVQASALLGSKVFAPRVAAR